MVVSLWCKLERSSGRPGGASDTYTATTAVRGEPLPPSFCTDLGARFADYCDHSVRHPTECRAMSSFLTSQNSQTKAPQNQSYTHSVYHEPPSIRTLVWRKKTGLSSNMPGPPPAFSLQKMGTIEPEVRFASHQISGYIQPVAHLK